MTKNIENFIQELETAGVEIPAEVLGKYKPTTGKAIYQEYCGRISSSTNLSHDILVDNPDPFLFELLIFEHRLLLICIACS